MANATAINRAGLASARPAASAELAGILYLATDTGVLSRCDDDGGGWTDVYDPTTAGSGDVTYAAILAAQLVNEIKGWPPVVNTGDLDALNLWFDKVGTPTGGIPVAAVSGEAGITETWELAFKVTAAAGGDGLSQRFTYADESRVKAGRRLSTLWAIWCVGGVGATLSIINSSSEETAATKVTAAAWTVVEVPNHLLAGTYCDVKIVADGAGVFYAVPLGANIGARGFPLQPRPSRFVSIDANQIVNAVDPGATWTEANAATAVSKLAWRAQLSVYYANGTSTGKTCAVRPKWSTDSLGILVCRSLSVSVPNRGVIEVPLNDSQLFEFIGSDTAGNTESVTIHANGYWEWA